MSLLASTVAAQPDPLAEPAPTEAAEPVPNAEAEEEAEHDGFDETLVLDSGRFRPPPPSDEDIRFAFHGEYQLRFRAASDLRLEQPIGAAPGTAGTLGQNYHLYQWLRLRPIFRYRESLEVAGEIDVPRGMIAGQTTTQVTAARDSLDEARWWDVHPRQLYLQYLTPVGLFRIGHQTSHWGMGLLANDGDHPTLFGDYRRGSIVERILFATRPGGADHPLVIALAGDFVFEDARADAIDDGDRALQAVLAVMWQEKQAEIGLYGVFRHQERDSDASAALTPFTEELTVGVADLAGKFHLPVGSSGSFLFGEMEAAFIGGRTTFVRTLEQLQAGEQETILSWGGAARLGAVTVQECGDERWGAFVLTAEVGYASGDADPYDGVTRRFTFDENHNVGLVLFDHVLAWKTARAATIAQDPAIVARPNPGLSLLPSNGGVFGASYLYPTVVVRPRPWLDLKGGVVIADTTADLVDPFHAGALGNYRNYDGGDPRDHDLGIELDAGADVRIPLGELVRLQLGIEGGVLFPGNAFDDEAGNDLPNQYLLNSKLGLQI
jgi:hypothetical protein